MEGGQGFGRMRGGRRKFFLISLLIIAGYLWLLTVQLLRCVSQHVFSSLGWDLKFYRNLHERELESFANLSLVLEQVHLNEELADLRLWNRIDLEGSHINQL